jgi:hypothetical protein
MSEKEIKGVRVIVFNVIFRKERKRKCYLKKKITCLRRI